MKFRFDVGDRVRVLDGKSIDSWDSDVDGYTGSWDPSMEGYVGRIATVWRPVAVYSRPAYRLRFDDYEDWHDWDERGLVRVREPRFKEGDMVRVLNAATGQQPEQVGNIYTIESVEANPYPTYRLVGTHYVWIEDQLEPVLDCISIYSDGKRVTARDDARGIAAEAKCSPNDKFDFYTGAVIALERLREMEHKQKSIEVGDVVRVVDTGHCYTTYSKWSGFSDLPTGIVARYAYGEGLGYLNGINKLDTEYSVLAVAEDKALIVASHAEQYGKCYLIGLAGLEKV